jgi:deoxyribonuclease-4
MLLGCHLSIAGGVDKAIDRAEELGINAVQIFSHNARSWHMGALKSGEAERFQSRREKSPVEFVVIHTIYLINLASPDQKIFEQSVQALISEVERAGALGIEAVNTHVGAHTGSGREAGLKRIIAALARVLADPKVQGAPNVKILLENDAGEGTALGVTFEELGMIFDGARQPERLGLCWDTCHAFAAGYDFRTTEGLERMLQECQRHVGLERLQLIHVNDSKHPLGSHRDRHEHIGQGYIGLEGFRPLINHPKLRAVPLVLETPKETDETKKLDSNADPINLAAVRGLRGDA